VELSDAGYELTAEALFRAAGSDDLAALDKLISAGMGMTTRDATGRTALHAAAGAGALQSVDRLLDLGMEIDIEDAAGRTPLMEAVVRSTPEAARYLLRQGADPLRKDRESYKPLMLAVKEGRREMVPELAPYVREDLDDALLVASILGQAGVIDELTNFGASVYARLEDGRTPLMLAAQNGHPDAVDMLLSIGANRFAMDSEGRLAADIARGAGHDELADRLATEPQEGDFELREPVELGAEMASRMGGPGDEGRLLSSMPELGSGRGVPTDFPEDGEALAGPGVPELEGAHLGQGPGGEVEVTVPDGLGGGVAARPSALSTGTAPVVMRAYRQTELPLRLGGVKDDTAEIKVAGGASVTVAEGEEIPGSPLVVVRLEFREQQGKEQDAVETSVVEVEDRHSGVRRELVAGLPALAHDPVALVQDSVTGRLYVARGGQRFLGPDGDEWRVGDVRPTQVVLENLATGKTMTVPLRGTRG